LADVPVPPAPTDAQKRVILLALAVVLLLSALDQTIVATAMPRIIEQLQGLPLYAWVTTAYMLTSTVTVPIYGKLSDLYGRRPILIFGVLLFLAGSMLCGVSGEFGELPVLGGGMVQLIVFRAVQGLGGGALTTCTFAIIADLFPPRERGRLYGVFGSVFGLATVIGPFIGGFFADYGTVTVLGHEVAGWRWVFYVNLPLGLLALFMILYRMPPLKRGAGGRVDYAGAALLVLAFTPILLALSLGGIDYPWGSPRIIGLFATGAIALLLFLLVESRTAEALLPLHLFRVPTFRVATLAYFVVSMAFLGIVMFMPLYMQVVQGISATDSGLAMLPLMAGFFVSGTVCGRMVARTGRYKPFMICGGAVLIVGVVLLSRIGPATSTQDLAWRLLLTGLGLGPTQTLFSLVIQNAAPARELGVATSVSQFSRQIGATVGVAIFGTVLLHNLALELPRRLPLLPGMQQQAIDLSRIQSQAMNPETIRTAVDAALAERYRLVERAYRGEAAATREVIGDPRMLEQVKVPLRNGGIESRVHRELQQRADHIASELRQGDAGRQRLVADAGLSPQLRQQLADLPARALRDAEALTRVTELVREAVMSQQSARVSAITEHTLQTIRAGLQLYAAQLTTQVHTGIKTAFSVAVASMLAQALWIVALGVLIILFIPELPLRSREHEADAAET
jgi:EmrB/QacA subfamily drug resistance transporter